MEDSTPWLFIWGIVFSVIGIGYMSFGKRRSSFGYLFSGLALCVYPYFVANVYLLVGIGVGLVILPFYLDF